MHNLADHLDSNKSSKPSLTYQEALKTSRVRIHAEDGIGTVEYRQDMFDEWSMSQASQFEFAIRMGYRIEEVED